MSGIVFFDIDGTLLDDNKKIPLSAKEAIFKLKDKGMHVAFATGRAPFMVEALREELDVHSFVCFNGQYVVLDKEVIYKNPHSTEHLEKFSEDAKRNGHPLVYLNEKKMKSTVEGHKHIEKSMRTLKYPYPNVDEHFFHKSDIYQTLVFCNDEEEAEYVGKYDHFHFIRWHKYSLDVLPFGGSKAVGIEQMIAQLGYDMQDVYAFGDGLNDLEMIQAVGTGIAMENGVDLLKEHADFVAKKVTDDGIADSLKKLGLI